MLSKKAVGEIRESHSFQPYKTIYECIPSRITSPFSIAVGQIGITEPISLRYIHANWGIIATHFANVLSECVLMLLPTPLYLTHSTTKLD